MCATDTVGNIVGMTVAVCAGLFAIALMVLFTLLIVKVLKN
jgi:hypothetical protein